MRKMLLKQITYNDILYLCLLTDGGEQEPPTFNQWQCIGNMASYLFHESSHEYMVLFNSIIIFALL